MASARRSSIDSRRAAKPCALGSARHPHPRLGRHLGQERPPEVVVLKASVPGRPPHGPAAPPIQERLRVKTAGGAQRHPVVDLVCRHGVSAPLASGSSQVLVHLEPHPDREQSEPGNRSARRRSRHHRGRRCSRRASGTHHRYRGPDGRPRRARALPGPGPVSASTPDPTGSRGSPAAPPGPPAR